MTKKNLVLHFKTGAYLPVTENWIHGQLTNLHRYKPIVYACDRMNDGLFPVDTVRTLSVEPGGRQAGTFRKGLFYTYFLYWLLKDKPSLVHAHFGPSGQRFLLLNTIATIPLITAFYGYDINQLVREHPIWTERYLTLFRKGTAFLVEGSNMKRSLVNLGCPSEKILIHHLGADLGKIPFLPRQIAEDREIRVLMSASFREKKGLPYGVEAFARFRKANPGLKATLTILGDSSGKTREEEQKHEILNLIEYHNMASSVRLLGYQPHEIFVRELYRNHIFLAPSVQASDGDNEGGAPVSIIEASASGMPVLSTRHCDIPEVIIDERSGYLVPERDPATLADRLQHLANNSGQWKELGSFGRNHVEREYDIRRQAASLEDIYDTLLGRYEVK